MLHLIPVSFTALCSAREVKAFRGGNNEIVNNNDSDDNKSKISYDNDSNILVAR